ncbi:MAG: hypothetical protein WC565_03240 [Parcubacteria group bacterium]
MKQMTPVPTTPEESILVINSKLDTIIDKISGPYGICARVTKLDDRIDALEDKCITLDSVTQVIPEHGRRLDRIDHKIQYALGGIAIGTGICTLALVLLGRLHDFGVI